jgi:hypothetical protein
MTMTNEQVAEFLREQIAIVEKDKATASNQNKIVLVHLNVDIFLKMPYLFVALKSK